MTKKMMEDCRTTTEIPLVRLNPRAKLPRQKPGDIGLDVAAIDDVTLYTGQSVRVKTGLQLAGKITRPLPDDGTTEIFLKIEGRSGLAARYGIFPIGGIIDPDYRGEIEVVLFSACPRPYKINAGDRIAQLVPYAASVTNDVHKTVVTEVEMSAVSGTERGARGFGSTGT